nr:MAG TPA: hypothetical protein [Caudoviricetes sp.]
MRIYTYNKPIGFRCSILLLIKRLRKRERKRIKDLKKRRQTIVSCYVRRFFVKTDTILSFSDLSKT